MTTTETAQQLESDALYKYDVEKHEQTVAQKPWTKEYVSISFCKNERIAHLKI
jgi:hypothetical protein